MIVDFFLVFLSFSDVFFLRVLVLGSSFDLLLFGFLTVLIFRDEFVMLCYLSLRLKECLISYLMDLGEKRLRLLVSVLSKKYGISGRSQVFVF